MKDNYSWLDDLKDFNLTAYEDSIRVILEENALLWDIEPPKNLRTILDEITRLNGKYYLSKQKIVSQIEIEKLRAMLDATKGLYQSYLNDEFFNAEDFKLVIADLQEKLKELEDSHAE